MPSAIRGGAETRAQPEKEHLAALVAPKRLHRGIVDDLDGILERRIEVKPDPTLGEVVWLGDGPIAEHGSRIANRHRVIRPVLGEFLHSGDHHRRRQSRPGLELAALFLARC